MKTIVLVIAVFAGVSLYAVTNEVSVSTQTMTNSVPVKSIKVTKQPRSQCEAMTLSGNRCKRRAAVGSQYCSQHTAIMRKRKEGKYHNK